MAGVLNRRCVRPRCPCSWTALLSYLTRPAGHSYIAYGPLLNGTHTLLFEGTPTHPGPDRLWNIVAKHKATTLYTAPTAIRALMVHGDAPVKKHNLSSLRILGSVGEPINPEVSARDASGACSVTASQPASGDCRAPTHAIWPALFHGIAVQAWRWYHEVVGGGRCAIVDTYWQTETGGIIITPLPGARLRPTHRSVHPPNPRSRW